MVLLDHLEDQAVTELDGMRRLFWFLILVLFLGACGGQTAPPQAEPLRGLDGQPIRSGDFNDGPVDTDAATSDALAFETGEPSSTDDADESQSELVYETIIERAFGDSLEQLTDEQVTCIDREVDEFNIARVEPPPEIVLQFARVCAEEWWVDAWADTTTGPYAINLADREDRHCFAATVTWIANRDFRESLTWYTHDRMNPPDDERMQLDVFLETKCGLNRFEATEAGLSDLALTPAQSPERDDPTDISTFVGVLDQIRFSDGWVVSFSDGSSLAENVQRVEDRDLTLLTLPVSATRAPTPETVAALWADTEDVMTQAGFTLEAEHTCIKEDAAAVKIFSRADSVTGDALLAFYPDSDTALYVTVLLPNRNEGYIDRALYNWCL